MEVLHLTPTQPGELQAYLRKHNLPGSVAQRMRMVLLLNEGASYRDIEEKLRTPASTVSRWKQRYREEGLGNHPSGQTDAGTTGAGVGATASTTARRFHASVVTQEE